MFGFITKVLVAAVTFFSFKVLKYVSVTVI